MLIAKVIGTTVSTIKDEKLYGRKLLILRQTDETGAPSGKPYVAVDTVDAGIGDLVLTAAGSSARSKPRPMPARRLPNAWVSWLRCMSSRAHTPMWR